MTPQNDIIGLVKESLIAQQTIKELLADSDWELNSEKAKIVISCLRAFPVIAESLLIAVEALEESHAINLNMQMTSQHRSDASLVIADKALSRIRSLPLS